MPLSHNRLQLAMHNGSMFHSWTKREKTECSRFPLPAALAAASMLALLPPHVAAAKDTQEHDEPPDPVLVAAQAAERQLHETFTNLQFQDFGPSPVKGPIFQASAGGRIVYYAPQSEHLLFASVYDRNGVNLTALAQEQGASRRLKAIDPARALAIGPADAPSVIEFTDPDCPCQHRDKNGPGTGLKRGQLG